MILSHRKRATALLVHHGTRWITLLPMAAGTPALTRIDQDERARAWRVLDYPLAALAQLAAQAAVGQTALAL